MDTSNTEADWDWADELLQSSTLWASIENHIDESEFLQEIGHIYQLDCGGCAVVTPEAEVILKDSPDDL